MKYSMALSKFKSDYIWPPFGQKTVENGEIHDFASFLPFFDKRLVKCYLIWILRPNLESSHQGTSLRPHNQRGLKALFVGHHGNFKTLVLICARHRANRFLKRWYHWTRDVPENHISRDPVNFLTKVEIWEELTNYRILKTSKDWVLPCSSWSTEIGATPQSHVHMLTWGGT